MIKTISQAIDDMAVSLGASPSAEIPTVAQALENVYTALGGDRTDLDTLVVSEVIDLVAPLIQGGGGGGTTFPTFTQDASDNWSCDLTYSQTYELLQSDGVNNIIPCVVVSDTSSWAFGNYMPNGEFVQHSFDGVPETVNYGFRIMPNNIAPKMALFFADDGNCYNSVV